METCKTCRWFKSMDHVHRAGMWAGVGVCMLNPPSGELKYTADETFLVLPRPATFAQMTCREHQPHHKKDDER